MVSLCATAAAIVASLVGALALPYPHNAPFILSGSSFADYYIYFQRFYLLHSASFFTARGYPFTYLATGVPLYGFFYGFGIAQGLILYFALASLLLTFAFVRVRSALLRRAIRPFSADSLLFIMFLTSYPLAYCFERGNLEFFAAAGIAIGTWAYWKERTWTAAILWGVFGSVKLYPLLLLAIFISFRQYRQFFASIASALCVSIVALLYIGPDFHTALAGISGSLPRFVSLYTLRIDTWICFDHSIFALLKLTFHPSAITLPRVLHFYFITLAATMLTVYCVRIRKLPVANQLLALSICSILLPPTSFDYSILQLYAPFIALMFVAIDSSKRLPGMSATMVLLALLFTPTNFLPIAGDGRSGQIKCVLLIALLVASLIWRFPEPSVRYSVNHDGTRLPPPSASRFS
jgi:hypothetical protein